jgi:hypothetical protein
VHRVLLVLKVPITVLLVQSVLQVLLAVLKVHKDSKVLLVYKVQLVLDCRVSKVHKVYKAQGAATDHRGIKARKVLKV